MDLQGESSTPLSAAEEKKRKRLLAWKRKQEQQQQAQTKTQPKVSLSLSLGSKKKKGGQSNGNHKIKPVNPFDVDEEDTGDNATSETMVDGRKRKRPEELMEDKQSSLPGKRTKGSRRWDNVPQAPEKDALDQFMEKLEAGAMGKVNVGDPVNSSNAEGLLSVHVGASMMTSSNSNKLQTPQAPAKNVITAEELLLGKKSGTEPLTPEYGPKDWLSDAPADTDDEQEEHGRRALIEALAAVPPLTGVNVSEGNIDGAQDQPAQLAAQVKSEKNRRKQRLEELERQADEARQLALAAAEPEVGRYLYSDAVEEGIMEEAERNLDTAKAAPDALTVLAELNKKKELKAVDHSKIDYLPFQKNLYIVPRSLANLNNDEVISRRAKLRVRVRGQGAPAPVSSFEECGLSERILSILSKQGITKPYPVQAQCIPCAMAGRDVIGIAKTGSGKTLAYLLPMLRHILVQPPLEAGESGPIGLIVAPARELAFQINTVSKSFAKQLGLKSVIRERESSIQSNLCQVY
ncbi:hypothetical protein ACA910_016507 [Epithemia clementina (nom. ined.)]